MDQLLVLTLYSRPGCHLCDEMKALVARTVRETAPDARIEEVNIAGRSDLEARYGSQIPVLLVNGRKAAKYRVTYDELTRLLKAEQEGGGGGLA
jgi:hypothetical protein